MHGNPFDAYREAQAATLRGSKQVVQLYDRAIRQAELAREKLLAPSADPAAARKQSAEVAQHLARARKVVTGLQRALRVDGTWEGAEELYLLYQLVLYRVADPGKGVAELDEALGVLTRLREAWREASKNTGDSPPQAQGRSEFA
ncbi:MAG: flagellar protein FliS [Candidatus Sericytochromatia bacterium]|nr:flagellar protein FliS [Candidatus Tanganyikabacteria bacterium]